MITTNPVSTENMNNRNVSRAKGSRYLVSFQCQFRLDQFQYCHLSYLFTVVAELSKMKIIGEADPILLQCITGGVVVLGQDRI